MRIVRTLIAATITAVVVGCVLIGLAVAGAHAATARPYFTCPTGSVCTFTETNLGGTGLNLPDAAIPSGTVWNLVDYTNGHAQSVRNRGGNTLWVADYQTGDYLCVPDTDWINTNGMYGHAERTGAYPCTGGPPPNLFTG